MHLKHALTGRAQGMSRFQSVIGSPSRGTRSPALGVCSPKPYRVASDGTAVLTSMY